MKNSKILLFLLAILMIVSISAVSAEDIADSDDLSLAQDDSTPLEVDEAIDNLQAEDESPQSAETGDNFTSLQTEIDGGATEITLEKDYARAVGEKDIVIDKDFTIDGQGKYSIHAAESGRIFNVTADHTLTLKGLTLIGGNVNGNGGAVYSEGNLNLIDCTFTNNVASMFGGAVFVNGTATIEGCVFKENTALQGTVYNQNEKLTVKNTLFDNNTAKGNAATAILPPGRAVKVTWPNILTCYVKKSLNALRSADILPQTPYSSEVAHLLCSRPICICA